MKSGSLIFFVKINFICLYGINRRGRYDEFQSIDGNMRGILLGAKIHSNFSMEESFLQIGDRKLQGIMQWLHILWQQLPTGVACALCVLCALPIQTLPLPVCDSSIVKSPEMRGQRTR